MTARDVMYASMSARQFRGFVVDMATAYGWRVYQTHDSQRSAPGWPDIAAVRDGILLLAELNSQLGRVRPEQIEWFAALKQVEYRAGGSVIVRSWRPSDMREVETILTGARGAH